MSTLHDLVVNVFSQGAAALAGPPGPEADDVGEAGEAETAHEVVVHQTRVATRRARSRLRALEPWLDPHVVTSLVDDLGGLADSLGAVRDLDVIEQVIESAAVELATDSTGAMRPSALSLRDVLALLRALDRERTARRAELDGPAASAAQAALVERLTHAARVPPLRDGVDPDAPASAVARRAMRRAWKRVRTDLRALGSSPPSDEALHRLRRRAKRARYVASLAAPVVAGSSEAFHDEMKRIQTRLGAAQDASTTLAWLERAGRSDPASAFTAGQLWVVVDGRRRDAVRAFLDRPSLRRAERAACWF